MQFISLKFVVRIERRIAIVETNDEADVDDAILHAVDESTAERLGVERPPERVNDRAGCEAIIRKLPELLHAERVNLRIFSIVKIEHARQLFAQRAAWTFRDDRDLRADIDARLVVRLSLTEFVDSFVSDTNPHHPSALDQDARRGELGKNVDTFFGADWSEPSHELTEGDDVVAVVLDGRRKDRSRELPVLRHQPEGVIGDWRFDRASAREPIGHQLTDSARIHHCARDSVRPDFFAFFEDGDRDAFEFFVGY